ncbi:low temperature requirement protein A [Streptococcus panodentis]|uniref:Low temperature requirement protein A n=1 Tax=Streptococcus panodentis TaxID=1581472 RepID=A0ABS5ATI3_9STRE|nr:low temperature requirement protein A [Streptococcus panodentis]MBP2619884.1 low temperature requirement protein A [Streptococcus panodentis]
MSKIIAKRVSNYELFFDLAFVLAISQLTAAIHVDHVGWEQVLSFIATNTVMLSIWNNEAYYYNRYGDSRAADIYTVILLMLWVGNLALSFTFDVKIFQQDSSPVIAFNTFLILSYLTIALQYYFKGRKLGFSKDIKLRIGLLSFYSLLLLPIATGILPFSLYLLPLYFLPLFQPLFLRNYLICNSFNFPHALERNQLLTIITFGESVIAAIRTYPLAQRPFEGVALFLGIGFLFAFYIVQTFININHHQKASPVVLYYAHIVIIISLMFFTVGIEFLANEHHHDLGLAFFIFSILAFFAGTLSTSYYNHELYRLDKTVLIQYAAILLLGTLSFYLLSQSIMLLGLALVAMSFLMQRTSMRYRRLMRERHRIPHPDPTQNLRDFS